MLSIGPMKRPLLPEARAGVGAAFVLLCLVLAAEVADGVDANYVGLLAAAPFLAAAFASWPEVLAVGSASTVLALVFCTIELMHSRERMLVMLLNLGAVILAAGIASAVGAIRQRQIDRIRRAVEARLRGAAGRAAPARAAARAA